jgi:hypothetical protein
MFGIKIIESSFLERAGFPPGDAFLATDDETFFVPAHTRYGERFMHVLAPAPLQTRHCLGVIEAARSERRRRRGLRV